MVEDRNRNLILKKAQTQALAEVRQFENRLLETITPEPEINPAIVCRPAEGVRNIVFTPDGRFIAVAMGRSIQIWDSQAGKCIQVLNGHTSLVRSLAITPDGHRFLSSGWGEIILWERKSGQPVWKVGKGKGNSSQIALISNGEMFVQGSYRSINFCDLNTGHFLRSLSTNHTSITGPLAVDSGGERIASACFESRLICLFDLRIGKEVIDLTGHSGPVEALAMTPDGRMLVSGSEDCTLRLWDLDNKRCMSVLAGHYGSVCSVAITPDGKTVISGSEDKTIRVWDVQSGRQQQVLLGNLAEIHALAVSPDGLTLVSGGSDSSIILWDLSIGQPKFTLVGLTRSVTSIDLSTEELLVACTDHDEQVIRLRKYTPDGMCSYGKVRLIEHRKNAGTAISPDHKMICTGGRTTIYLYDIASGRLIRKLNGHTDFSTGLKFSPDGRLLFSASASLDKTWRVWDLQTGECLKAVNGRSEGQVGLYAIAFHPNGREFLLSGVAEVSMWDMKTGQHIRKVLERHDPHMIMALAIHPDGKTFVTGAWDEKIRVWDLETGEHLRTLEGHQRIVSSLTFNRDGRLLISGSEGGQVNFWDYEKNELLATAHNVDEGYLWTTPPDDFAGNGWLYTDRPDLIGLTAVNPENGEMEYIPENDRRFIDYMQLYNDGKMVMSRINDRERYQELLRLRLGTKEQEVFAQIEARIATEQRFYLESGGLSTADGEEDQA